MKKKLSMMLLAAVIMCGLTTFASAAGVRATTAAEALYELGLFRGTGTNPDGTPIFDLDKTPTRNQAIIMLVRLLGKEGEALAGDWELPFTDVAKDSTPYPYIGYAYANGLTNGTTATTYSGTNPIRANQYITFVLRALGYESGKDFQVAAAWELSDDIGLTSGAYTAATTAFRRGDVAIISGHALETNRKASEQTLADKLIEDGVFTQSVYDKATEPPVILEMESDASKYGVPYSYEINGEIYSGLKNIRPAAGTYTVTPLYNGIPFRDCTDDSIRGYTVKVEDGSGSVKKNSDGTFTVDFPAKDSLSIALWFTYEHRETNSNGQDEVSYSKGKTNFSFTAPIPSSGFALDMNGSTFLPGNTFGTYTPYYVLRIYYNGVMIDDYAFNIGNAAPFNASIQADGSLLLMKTRTGRCSCTITYQGKSATFGLVAN